MTYAGNPRDPLALVEHGYQTRSGISDWIRELAAPISHLADSAALGWIVARISSEGADHIYAHSLSGASDADILRETRNAMAAGNPGGRLATSIVHALRMQGIYSTVETAGTLVRGKGGERVKLMDTHSVVMRCGGHTVVFISLARQLVSISPGERALWRRLTAHLAAGCRLAGREDSTAASDVEAVLDPNGSRLLHAEGDGRTSTHRELLRKAACDMERARRRRGSVDADQALELWRGLVMGRWSLVDHFDSDGKRFILARKNEPDQPGSPSLTERQRQILFYVGAGWSNKEIGYVLGLAESTVGVHLRNALLALNLPSRAAWIALDSRLTLAAQDCS